MTDSILWVDPYQYTPGKSFRVFPVGTFKRGERTIDLTPARLQQMKENYDAQRPRWKIPIYAGHPTDAQPDPPKLGNVSRLELQQDGLYAVPEYNEDGQTTTSKETYQYVSPGVLWGINGSKYADENGTEFDNVIDHVALTNRPFFGSQTAIFSSDPLLMEQADKFTRLTDLERESVSELFREFDTETRDKLAKSGAAMADGSYPIENASDLSNAIHAIGRGKGSHAAIKAHIIKRARALGKTDMLPEDWSSTMSTDTMGSPTQNDVHAAGADADKNKEDETPAEEAKKKKKGSPEEEKEDAMSEKIVTTEEFDALKTKAEGFDAMLKKQADEFTAKLAASDERAKKAEEFAQAERKTRRMNELTHVAAEKFSNLPIKAEEFAEKFYAVSEVNPEAAKWFSAKFEEFDTLIAQGALFNQFSRTNVDPTVETLSTLADKILAEKFGGNDKKRVEALAEAGKLRPDLAMSDLNTFPVMRDDIGVAGTSGRTVIRYK